MRWLDGIIDSMVMSLSKFLEMVKLGKPGMLQSMGLQRVRHDLATEQQQLSSTFHLIWKHSDKGCRKCVS